MTIWDWIAEYRKRAQADGDKSRLRLTEIQPEAWRYRESDPDRMLGLFLEGACLAEQLSEPWWVLCFHAWRLEVLLFWKRDFRNVHDLAVANVLKVRSPACAAYPAKFSIYRDLKCVYQGIDPVGYEDEIRGLLDFFAKECASDGRDRSQVLRDRCCLAVECGQLEQARDYALHSLAIIDSEVAPHDRPWNLVCTLHSLPLLAYWRREWNEVREWAKLGVETAITAGWRLLEGEFLAWQAVVARHERDEKTARCLKRRAAAKVGRVRSAWDGPYWDALRAFHELGGELEEALRVVQREYRTIVGRGMLGGECEALLKQCRLLAKLGRLTEDHAVAVRTAADRLRKPGMYLAKLAKFLQGDFDGE